MPGQRDILIREARRAAALNYPLAATIDGITANLCNNASGALAIGASTDASVRAEFCTTASCSAIAAKLNCGFVDTVLTKPYRLAYYVQVSHPHCNQWIRRWLAGDVHAL